MTKKDMENILNALGEASFSGLCRFVVKSKMNKGVEVIHCFDEDKFTPDINLPAVRITIEPFDKEEAQKLKKIKNRLIN